jgi:hypothetical protein
MPTVSTVGYSEGSAGGYLLSSPPYLTISRSDFIRCPLVKKPLTRKERLRQQGERI